MTLKEATRILSDAGVRDARHDARVIFKELGGLLDYELLSPLCEVNSREALDAIARRAKREPLQYIIGAVDFYRERYKVSPDCLIPRADTELLVDYAVNNIPEGKAFLDLCTGSGCVGLSVLNNTKDTRCTFVDISDAALLLARENAERLGLSDRAEFIKADVTSKALDGEFYAVLSNPPYVTNDAYKNLEREIYFEPSIAFVGGEDGGDFYRAITPLYRPIIEKGGFLAYEIGYDQKELIEKIAYSEGLSAEVFYDLGENPRVAVLKSRLKI